MKISICIPQYNRIQFLIKSLQIIELQKYENIEVVISDDCSSDDTQCQIQQLIPNYKYPIIYSRNITNMGYDFNYRNCISLATGLYAFVIGNDDTIYDVDSISYLVNFLSTNNFPEIGFCNMVEDGKNISLINRAINTGIIGTGVDVALKNYSNFSFVGGLIYKREAFLKYNTNKFDGSIYSQMYLGLLMVCSGEILFSIHQPLVLKDIVLFNIKRDTYKDKISRKWKEFKIVDSGLHSVIHVLISGLQDSNHFNEKRAYKIFKRIYSITFPHWVLDYKDNAAYPEAIGLICGLYPKNNRDLYLLNIFSKVKIFLIYFFASFLALVTPTFIYKPFKQKLYSFFKK